MMKRIFALILAVNFVFPPHVFAVFEDLGAGARAPGMADVFVGTADNADAIYYNPAGLANLKSDELSMQYGQLLRGADDGSNLGTTYLAAAHRLKNGERGTIGFAYNNFSAQGLFSERTLILSYGWKLSMVPMGLKGLWSMGANFKQLHRQYEPDRFTENALNDGGNGSGSVDPVFAKNGYGKDAYAMDWGAQYQFGPSNRASAGLSLININRPDVSLGSDGDKAPFIGKLGASYRSPWATFATELRRTTRMASQMDTDLAFAVEKDFKRRDLNGFAIRGGYATGSREYKAMTAGLSYAFSKVRLDYAFNFPLATMQDSQGSHRLGLSILLGADKGGSRESTVEDNDLLASFAHDSTAARLILQRGFYGYDMSDDKQALLLQLLVNKYSMDKHSVQIHQDLSKLQSEQSSKLMEWPELTKKISQQYSGDDMPNVSNTLNIYVKGDSDYTLARLALLSATSKTLVPTKMLSLLAHAELAAQNYRAKSLDGCIDHVRQIMEILPQDAAVVDAYRKLLLMRTQKQTPTTSDTAINEVLPDAPISLTAPVPVSANEQSRLMSEKDASIRAYGTQMGYYFGRKAEGASDEEKRGLLLQIRTLYGGKGIDMGLLDREAALLKQATPQPKPVSTPHVDVVPEPEETPTEVEVVPVVVEKKPAKAAPTPLPAAERKKVVAKYKIAIKAPIAIIASSPELDWALTYYKKAVERGISDHERIEILESIVIRFGERGGTKVTQELDRIRKRVQ